MATRTATLLRLLRFARPYRWQVAGLFLLDQLTVPLGLLFPLPMAIAIDTVVNRGPAPAFLHALLPETWTRSPLGMLWFAVALQLALALSSLLRDAASNVLSVHAAESLTIDFRARVFRHAQRLSLAFHDSRGTADSIYRIQYDTQAVQWVIVYGIGPLTSNLIKLLAMIGVSLWIHWQLALIALTVTPALVLATQRFNKVFAPRYTEVREQESGALGVIQEVLTSLRVVKAFGREQDEQTRFEHRSVAGRRAKVRLAAAEGAFSVVLKLITAFGAALVLFIGIRAILDGGLTIGQLLVIMYYQQQVYGPLEQITRKIADLQYAAVSAARAFELLDHRPDVTDRPQARPLARARGEVELRGVCFSYTGAAQDAVLRDVTFRVEPGAVVGIVGQTGAGKSTLVSLLMRFYDPTAGAVVLDGVDVRDYRLADLREQFSIVLQEPVLFSTTVAENIAYSRPGATMAQITHAAQAANADEFVRAFPEGYATQVGERGLRLSGGERQRVSIARAFLKDAPILILDEPTSSVDMPTEARIMEAMDRLMRGRTVFIIAHRLNTLARCDVILRVDRGCVVEDRQMKARVAAVAQATGELDTR